MCLERIFGMDGGSPVAKISCEPTQGNHYLIFIFQHGGLSIWRGED